MTELVITIGNDGTTEVLVKNTLEDLRHDFQYFLKEAKAHAADTPETMFLHKRFLRAALFVLFAYVEGVTNEWLSTVMAKDEFQKMQFNSLDRKVEWLCKHASRGTKPSFKQAKQQRNLLVHFSGSRDSEAFDNLSLTLVEEAAAEIKKWKDRMESDLGMKPHASSDELLQAFAELGTTTKEISTDPTK